MSGKILIVQLSGSATVNHGSEQHFCIFLSPTFIFAKQTPRAFEKAFWFDNSG